MGPFRLLFLKKTRPGFCDWGRVFSKVYTEYLIPVLYWIGEHNSIFPTVTSGKKITPHTLSSRGSCPLSPDPHPCTRVERTNHLGRWKVSRRFCVGRVQFAGRGLVHRLPWPEDALDRTVIPESVLPRLRAPSTTKRKIQDGDDHPTNGISQWNSGSRLKDRVPRKESHREGDGGVHGTGTVINGGGGGGDKVEEDAAAARGTRHSRGYRRSDRVEDFAQGNCECPCFCGRSVSGSNCSAFIGREGGTGVRGAAVGGAAADLSRVEQLVGRAAQARGCAYGVEWVARATEESPGLSVPRALDALDCAMREGEGAGLEALLCHRATSEEEITRRAVQIDDSGRGGLVAIDACCGPWVARPRRFEVAAALHRLPGVRFRRAPEVASVDTARSCLGLDHSGKIDAS